MFSPDPSTYLKRIAFAILLININFAIRWVTAHRQNKRKIKSGVTYYLHICYPAAEVIWAQIVNATGENVTSFTIHRRYDSCPCNRRFWLSCNARCQTTARFWRVHRSRDSQEFGQREESPTFEKSVPRKCKVRTRISRSRPHEEGIVDWVSVFAIFCRSFCIELSISPCRYSKRPLETIIISRMSREWTDPSSPRSFYQSILWRSASYLMPKMREIAKIIDCIL